MKRPFKGLFISERGNRGEALLTRGVNLTYIKYYIIYLIPVRMNWSFRKE